MEFGKEYIKVFDTEAEYLAFKASDKYNEPNVTYVKVIDVVHYNKYILPESIEDAVVTCDSKTYNGQSQVATNIVVTLSGNTLEYNVDYEVTGNTGWTNAGSYNFTVTGKGHYTGSTIGTFTINKVTPTVTAPTAKTGLVYNTSSQALINAGSTNYGTLQYSLDNSSWGTAIPSGTNASSYTVYYKVVGDSNINDVAASSVACSIAKVTPTVTAPTAKVLTYNGTSQQLANAGSTNYGTIKYNTDGGSWQVSVPSRTNGGSYSVGYKVEGDSNVNDVAAQYIQCSNC